MNVVVTGASRGIGYLLTRGLLERGCRVVGVARSIDRLKALERMYSSFYGVPCDLSKLECYRHVYRESLRILGSVDVLVNNAGYTDYGFLWMQTLESIYRQIMVNMVAPIILTRLFLEHFLEKKSGKIVFLLTAGVYVYLETLPVYGAAKTGLDYIANILYRELPSQGIDVVLVYPGRVKGTDFFKKPSLEKVEKQPCSWMECTSVDKVVDKILEAVLEKGSKKIHIPLTMALLSKLTKPFTISIKY